MADRNILLVLTGGTICSFGDGNNNNRDTDLRKAKRILLENFRNSSSDFYEQSFDEKMPIDVLSENMTFARWNELLQALKSVDYDKYKGVIVAHGTDTLAYSASLLSLALSSINKPVFIVSGNLPLDNPQTNGNDNFRAAVELICRGFEAGGYVTYRNNDGQLYIHKGNHIRQSGSYEENFYSADALKLKDYINGAKWETYNNIKTIKLEDIGIIKDGILYIRPYIGLDYSRFDISGSIKAVVHGTYHSQTVCVAGAEQKAAKEGPAVNSIFYLLDKCREQQIPLIVGPCMEDINLYRTTAKIKDRGAVPIYGMTDEMLYVKTVLGIAMGYDGKDLIDFLRRDICGEYII